MKTEINKSSKENIKKIISITIGTLVIVGGFTILIKLSKVMITDFKDIGL